MAVKKDRSAIKVDILKWIASVVIIACACAANYYLIEVPKPLRVAGLVLLICIAIVIAFQTTKGRQAWKFFRESRNEVRKVVWPNRQTTFQTTLIVMVVVVIFAVVMWGVDAFLMRAVGWLTGQGG